MLLQAYPTFPSSFSSSCSASCSFKRLLFIPHQQITTCSIREHSVARNRAFSTTLIGALAATSILFSLPKEVIADNIFPKSGLCQLASITETTTLVVGQTPSPNMGQLMMRGMTANNFDPSRYAGRWFEVASLKRGFAGQGQEDCHCTQGIYSFDANIPSIQVDTFCVHGSPDGFITGIRGNVQCLSEEDLVKSESPLEKQEMIRGKCYLRFPTLPFIPKEPYDVIATDYDNYALVSGAKDKSFIQIYSRTPNPGQGFIDKYKSYLSTLGYDATKINETPQDCQVMSSNQLSLMMSRSGMKEALMNKFPDLELKAPLALNPFTSMLDTVKKLVELYFK